jgi:hypothetical protein
MAPVLQIMLEVQVLCTRCTLLSVEHAKVGFPLTLSSLERSDVAFAPIASSPILNLDALFAKELCDVLIGLEATISRCGREIVCLLTGTIIKDKIKMGDCPRTGIRKEKLLKCKEKKSDAMEKAPAVA